MLLVLVVPSWSQGLSPGGGGPNSDVLVVLLPILQVALLKATWAVL